ncbi:hypothetical protein BP00DRAFT_426555 [Aspergillus indologenus CBS 114.80]|uniref:Uncharacterized protein n=1 Tax=Aspergillus indologenus CBS 114.80 TaxID=1450541 RepID=A0A2V5I0W3_9EURO|nr:hypothetical protein BP00DRAFT_426555 [Aspergillus indologenus CBS 114.80]
MSSSSVGARGNCAVPPAKQGFQHRPPQSRMSSKPAGRCNDMMMGVEPSASEQPPSMHDARSSKHRGGIRFPPLDLHHDISRFPAAGQPRTGDRGLGGVGISTSSGLAMELVIGGEGGGDNPNQHPCSSELVFFQGSTGGCQSLSSTYGWV